MRSEKNDSSSRGETRRQFLKKTGATAALVGGAGLWPLNVSARETPSVAIVLDPANPLTAETPVRWAAEQLRDALSARGVAARLHASLAEAPSSSTDCIVV